MSQPLSNPVPNQFAQSNYSENQSRSYTLQHILPNDILFDLTPSKTLEALTSSSSRLSKSIESISPSERAFGIRAAVASKRIHEWVEEISLWPWPKNGGSAVFGTISAKHRKLNTDQENFYKIIAPNNGLGHNFADYQADLDINQYENRLDEIRNDMQNLRVDEIKRQVLDTYIIARSGPSSFFSSPISDFFSSTSYTKMDDFSAMIIATVLQALPKLSRLVSLMEIWSRRLFILRKIPSLLFALEDAEIALESGWNTVQKPEISESTENGKNFHALSRETYDVMKYVLEEKVTTLGQSLDFMLNILEGSQDTLPDSWLDRMEKIEKEYGEWVVTCDSIVRRGELLKSDNSQKKFRSFVEREGEDNKLASKSGLESYREGDYTQDCSPADKLVKPKVNSENLGLTNQGSVQLESALALSMITLDEELQCFCLNSNARAEINEKIEVGKCPISPYLSKKSPMLSSLEPDSVEYDLRQKSSLFEKNQSIDRTDDHLLKSPESKQELNLEKRPSIIIEQSLDQKSAEISSEIDGTSTILKFNQNFNDEIKCEDSKNYFRDAYNQLQQCQTVSENSKLDNRSTSNHNQSLSNSEKPGQVFNLSSKTSRLDPKVDLFSISDRSDKSQINPITDSADEFNVEKSDLDQIKKQKLVTLDAINLQSESLSRNKSCGDIFDGQKVHISEASRTLNNTMIPNGSVPKSCSLNSSDSSNTSLSYDLNLDDKYDIKPSAIVNLTNPILGYVNDSSLEYENLISPTPVHFIENEKAHCSDSAISHLDGCSESRFINGVDTDDDNLDSSRIVPCLCNNQEPRSKPIPNLNINQPEITKFYGSFTDEDLNDDSADINLELVDSSPITFSSPTFKIIFGGEVGKIYSIELPLDGTTIYTNNSLSVSTIHSDFNILTLCDITTKGRTPSLISGSSGVFKIVPSQIIFSITYRALGTSALKAEDPRLESDLLLEKSSENYCFTRCADEDAFKGLPYILTIPQAGQMLNRSKISPVMEEEMKLSPQLSETCVTYSDYNLNSGQNQKDSFFSHAHMSSSTASDTSPYPSTHHNSTSFDAVKVIVESSVHSPPSYKSSPRIEKSMASKIFPSKEQSPLSGQANHLIKNCLNSSPPESPISRIKKPRSISFGPESSKPPKNRINPSLQDCKTSPKSKVKSSDGAQGVKDDQFQQQISSLLETIPSLVCLSTDSEPKTLGPEILRSRETRQSLSYNNRSSSSLSNHGPSHRGTTPPFTLIPAHGKGMSRQRHQNTNSEIRIYHLSRSNGEAPIKLFVRLVGEHGERVMVRVGGGWADLGEYLREYASHHCRRTDTDTIKIQETPSRKSSMGTLKSSSTNWETGCSSPLQIPQSVIGERQKSSLRVQKTRRSTGTTSTECLVKQRRAGSSSRCPSTPLPVIKHKSYGTPPSASSSSGTVASVSAAGTSDKSLRLSWTEDEFNLGLAGPRSKKSFISDRDQEWVESMQEKVRLASAEKDKRNRGRAEKLDKQRARGLSLDGMERIGSTIRLFRRDGSAA